MKLGGASCRTLVVCEYAFHERHQQHTSLIGFVFSSARPARTIGPTIAATGIVGISAGSLSKLGKQRGKQRRRRPTLTSHEPALSERRVPPSSPCSPPSSSSSPSPLPPRQSPPACPSPPSSGSTSPISSWAPPRLPSSIPPSAMTTPHAPSSSLAASPPAASPPPRRSCSSIFPLSPHHLTSPPASISTPLVGPFLPPRQIFPPPPLPPGTWPSVAMTFLPASPSSVPLPLPSLLTTPLPLVATPIFSSVEKAAMVSHCPTSGFVPVLSLVFAAHLISGVRLHQPILVRSHRLPRCTSPPMERVRWSRLSHSRRQRFHKHHFLHVRWYR